MRVALFSCCKIGAQASTLVAFFTDIWIKVDAERVMVRLPFFVVQAI